MPWISVNQWKKKHNIGIQPKKMIPKKTRPKKKFLLLGFDTFSSEWYSLGRFSTEAEAQEAAQKKLKENEQLQPSSGSGGQGFLGIQDRVFIEGPDGNRYRVFPRV